MCDVQPNPCSRKPSNCSRRASRSCSRQSAGNCGIVVPECMKASRKSSKCCNQPRADCCKIPCCPPPLPKCPLGIYVERVQPIRPDRRYEPPTFPFEALSSYREQFHLKCGDRSKSFKPLSTFEPSGAKMEGMSSYREFYTPKPLVPYQKPPWSKKAQYEGSGAKMDGISTYKYDFTGCMGDRVQSMKPLVANFDPSTAKMEGCTTYRCTYIPYCSREYDYAKQPLYKKQLTPSFSCAPMDGVTTYRSDFWPKCPSQRKSMKPSGKARFSDAKFADRTTYKNDYNPFTFEKCPPECIPAEVYDEKYNCANFACGLEKEPCGMDNYEEGCTGPVKVGGCGNDMGLMSGECCQRDPEPVGGDGDC